MENLLKSRVLNWFSSLLFVGVLIGGLCFLWPTYKRGRSLRLREAEIDQRLAEKREQIRELSENQRRFRTDRDFVELIARQNRRVFPGELVFVFKDH